MRHPSIAGVFLCGAMLAVGLSAGCNSKSPLADTEGTSPALDRQAALQPPLAAVKSDAEVAAQFSIPDPSPSEPVQAAMRIEPQSASAGDTAELVVYLRIARTHFVHASDPMDAVFTPIEVNVTLPEDLVAQGEWLFPAPEQGGLSANVRLIAMKAYRRSTYRNEH